MNKKRSTQKRKKNKKNERMDYRELVKEIKQIREEAQAKGIDLNARDDILECKLCGAYEDVFQDGEGRKTFLRAGNETDQEFIVLEAKERSLKGKPGAEARFKQTYRYICGVCGCHQSTFFIYE